MVETPEEGIVVLRAASPDDAAALAEIRVGAFPGRPSELVAAEVDFLDRLAIPHGEDYFCLLAEENGVVVSYLIGGGSRDLDHKAHGEVYEIAVARGSRRRGIGRRLLLAAIATFDDASFAGTLLSAPHDDGAAVQLAKSAAMEEIAPAATRPTFIRFERCRAGNS